jgi:hypothetical protein
MPISLSEESTDLSRLITFVGLSRPPTSSGILQDPEPPGDKTKTKKYYQESALLQANTPTTKKNKPSGVSVMDKIAYRLVLLAESISQGNSEIIKDIVDSIIKN